MYLESTVRNILGDMADHHNMVSKATLQSLSQGFPSFDNRIDNELDNMIQLLIRHLGMTACRQTFS
jgi:hypothetical protein